MNEQLIIKLRQIIGQNMPFINYDKATINTAIEAVYTAIKEETPLPGMGSFSPDQFDVIVGVIQAIIDKENETLPQEPYMAESARLKIALLRAGKLDTVTQAIAAADQETQIWWDYAINFDMLDARVQAMATALNISPEQLKQIWDLANSID